VVSKRIGIDCRLAGLHHAGIGRYVENLILRLPDLATKLFPAENITWVWFFHDPAQAKAIAKVWPSNVELVFVPIKHYSFKEQLVLPKVFGAAKLDLLHVPHFNIPWFYQGRLWVTIHDLLWHEHRGNQVTTLNPGIYWLKYGFYLITVWLAVHRSEKILVPAQTIRQIVLKYYPEINQKIVITPEGVGEDYAVAACQALKSPLVSHKIETPETLRLIYTGSLYPHKNLALVLRALVNQPTWQLTLVGSRNIFQNQTISLATSLGVLDQISWRGFLTDLELIKLYRQSQALVQPSLSEGFGLTGIEAMAAGTLVLAAKIPIFQEVYQTAAIYFDPHSVTDFVAAVKQLLGLSQTERQAKIQAGLKLSQTYDWAKLTQLTLETYLTQPKLPALK